MKKHELRKLGGPGSGHYGHKSVPGRRGGSAKAGTPMLVPTFSPLPRGRRTGAAQHSTYKLRQIGKAIEGSTPIIKQSSVISGTTASCIIKKPVDEVERYLQGQGYQRTDKGHISSDGIYRVTVGKSDEILYPGTKVVLETGQGYNG